MAIETELFLALNAGQNPGAYVGPFAVFVTRFALLLIPIGIVGLWFRGASRSRLLAFALALALLIAMGISFLIGVVAFRPRPYMVGLGHALVEHRPSASFPSNHTLAFAVCGILLLFVREYAVACIALALRLLVGWSRIYVGVHYPLDVLGAPFVAVPPVLISLWLTDRYGGPVVRILERVQGRLLPARITRIWSGR